MLAVLRDILFAAILLFFGTMAAVAQSGEKKFKFKRVLVWWGTFTILFAVYRIFF